MKKILVVDESRAVRETLALVLGRDFVVAQSPSLEGASPSLQDQGIDLLILGVSPASACEPSTFSNIAGRVSCPVLFLVDSQSAAPFRAGQSDRDCLAKPFNPYELKEKVAQLLARTYAPPRPPSPASALAGKALRYLDYPYVPASVSAQAGKFALAPLPILILAEAGCGQERLARAVHALNTKAGPWLSAHSSEVATDYLSGRIAALLESTKAERQRLTLFLSGLETLNLAAQSCLLDFLEEEEGKGRELWLISSSRAELLEKVYRGEFLDSLYYRLATLILRLPPLRDRQADIPTLADGLAQECAEGLGLGRVSFSPAAMERLRNYLWFGNVDEMETVIARTLATHRRELIDAPDLVLDVSWGDGRISLAPASEQRALPQEQAAQELRTNPAPREKNLPGLSRFGDGYSPDVRILISELAHELKNPMVTIKTFSQLLGDRFDDPIFRGQFQQTVSGDIQRMDDLLEALLDFSRFSQPAKEKIFLYQQLRRVEEELLPECIKRETAVQWGERGETATVFADKAQFLFAFKGILQATLTQVKPSSEIRMAVEGEGRVTISYLREAVGISSLNEYLGLATATNGEEALPLRVLLAQILIERNGGGIKIDYPDGGRVRIWAELPTV